MKQKDVCAAEELFVEENADEDTFFLPTGEGKITMVGPSIIPGDAGAIESDTYIFDVRKWC